MPPSKKRKATSPARENTQLFRWNIILEDTYNTAIDPKYADLIARKIILTTGAQNITLTLTEENYEIKITTDFSPSPAAPPAGSCDFEKIQNFIAAHNLPPFTPPFSDADFASGYIVEKTTPVDVPPTDGVVIISLSAVATPERRRFHILQFINDIFDKMAAEMPPPPTPPSTELQTSLPPQPPPPPPTFDPNAPKFRLAGEIYNIIGEGGFGKILRPQIRAGADFIHKTVDGREIPPPTDEERYGRVSKMFKVAREATKEIEFIRQIVAQIAAALSPTAQQYFFVAADYTYYELTDGNIFVNMPYAGKNLSVLLEDDKIQITPAILENLGKHNLFMMEEIFEKLNARQFYHNDVKSENLVLYPVGVDDYHIKIIDFGLSYQRGRGRGGAMDLPSTLQSIQLFTFNYPISKLLFSYIYLWEDDPDAAATQLNARNENAFLYKVVQFVKHNTSQLNHYNYFSTIPAIREIAAAIPNISTGNSAINDAIKTQPLAKLMIHYIRPLLARTRDPTQLKSVLIQNYFEILDVYGLMTIYLDILNQLLENPAQFRGINTTLLQQKLVLFLRDMVFTNHIEAGISHHKEMIKAHISDIHVDIGRAVRARRGGGGGAPPELSAFAPEKLGEWNYTIDPTAVAHYRANLEKFISHTEVPPSSKKYIEQNTELTQTQKELLPPAAAAAGGRRRTAKNRNKIRRIRRRRQTIRK